MRADPGAPPRDAGVGMVEVLVALMIVSLLAVWVAPSVTQAVVGTAKMRVAAAATQAVGLELDHQRTLVRQICEAWTTGVGVGWPTSYFEIVFGVPVQIWIDFPTGHGSMPSWAECDAGQVVVDVRATVRADTGLFVKDEELVSERLVVFVEKP